MSTTLLRAFACLFAVILSASPAAAEKASKWHAWFQDERIEQLASPQGPSPKLLKGLQKYFKDCHGITEVSDVAVVAFAKPTYTRPTAYGVVYATIGPERDRVSVKVDPATMQVLFFMWDGQRKREEMEAGPRTHKDAIAPDVAWKSMEPMLTYYGQTTGREDHEIEMLDNAGMARLDDLYGAKWIISEDLTYEGLRCPHRIIHIEVSAYSGKILHAQCWPVIPPRNKEPWISKEEAADHARAWLKQHSEDLKTGDVHVDEDALKGMIQTVELPNPAWMKYGTKAPAEKPGEAYVCWNVPVYFVDSYSGMIGSRLVVRADNGNVIDAYGVYPRLLPVGGVPPIASPADKAPSPKEAPSQ